MPFGLGGVRLLQMIGRCRLWQLRHSTSGSLNMRRMPEATHTWRGRMIDESSPTTSSRPGHHRPYHCRLMFSLISHP